MVSKLLEFPIKTMIVDPIEKKLVLDYFENAGYSYEDAENIAKHETHPHSFVWHWYGNIGFYRLTIYNHIGDRLYEFNTPTGNKRFEEKPKPATFKSIW